jgi:hypothetical protein
MAMDWTSADGSVPSDKRYETKPGRRRGTGHLRREFRRLSERIKKPTKPPSGGPLLKAVEKIDRSLRIGRGLKNGALVVLEDFEPGRYVGRMVSLSRWIARLEETAANR